ncbi:MAG: prepilin-type N-terminal cleavage/methylation domain-containing protein [Planctomycetota bacterium]|nr:MAG: prepilin-type N-terminal cleavage/methylation domain-containing protein [Planctomycetota bacterium]
MGEQVQEIVDADEAVAVKVGRVSGVRSPGAEGPLVLESMLCPFLGVAGPRQAGFTLTELLAVVLVLAVLAGFALPRFLDYRVQARRASMLAVMGAVQEGLALLQMQYATGDTAGLPGDFNGDYYPDNLGDVVRPEPTLFDAVLDTPIPHDDNGWKQYMAAAWPFAGTNYIYHYDTNGDNPGTTGEVLFSYNFINGSTQIFWIP